MVSKLKDHFSTQSGDYARYRPTYPDALFEYLASIASAGGSAWDCATGTGQAARGLARWFDRVYATDASESQIANALPQRGITFATAPAEASGLDAGSVDLVTVAQALHWFDLDQFYTEVRRVLRPGGVIAVWCYLLARVDETPDAILRRYYDELTGPYWPPERRMVESAYRTIPFPFVELEAAVFEIEVDWSVQDMLGYLGTWSASRRYKDERGVDPVGLIADEMREVWGDGTLRRVCWPMALRVGRVG